MFDDSGVSLSSSDPNPSIDQLDDGGDSADFSSMVSSAGLWGSEIARIVTSATGASGVRGRAPVPRPVAMQSSTKLLMVGLGVAAAVVTIYLVAN